MKRIIVLLFIFIMSFQIVFAAEATYKVKKVSGGGNQCNITFYNSNGEKIDSIEINRNIFDDTQLPKNGSFNKDALKKIKNSVLNYYIKEVDSILNSSGYAEEFRNNKTIKSYVPKNDAEPQMANQPSNTERSAKYLREEILAYNCNMLRKKLVSAKKGYVFTEYEEYTKSAGKGISLITYFKEDFIKEKEKEFKDVNKEYNLSVVQTGKLNKIQEIYTNSKEEIKQNVSDNEILDVGSKYDDNWWEAAQNFFNKNEEGTVADSANVIVAQLDDMIFNIGNMIFIVVTSLLGVKYIFASADGKAQVKDSLITLIVAALFFYGWSTIHNLLDIGGLLATGGLETTASKIYNTVLFIVNLLAVSGIIWIGVKYMFSSAEGRSQIKTNWVPLILGVVMVYGTIWFLTTIINAVL